MDQNNEKMGGNLPEKAKNGLENDEKLRTAGKTTKKNW